MQNTAAPAIEVRDVSKRYGAVEAVRGLSFDVAPGSSLALLGPNGAGKSTTIRMLATLLVPDGGTIRVAGHDLARDAASVRPLLGVALQDTGLPRLQSGRRLLRHHARLHGMSEREAADRAAGLVGAFGLDDCADRPLETCSGGERRRVDMAVALVHRPRVVLLDEPTTGLDVPSRRLIWAALREQIAGGTVLVFTTHQLQEADEHGDRVVLIDDGRLVVDSTPRSLKQRFGTRTVQLTLADAEQARRAVALLPDAISAGGCDVSATVADEGGLLEILRRLEAQDVVVTAATVDEPTLEQVFDRLTAGEEAREAAPA